MKRPSGVYFHSRSGPEHLRNRERRGMNVYREYYICRKFSKVSFEARRQQHFFLQRWKVLMLMKLFLAENQRILTLSSSRTPAPQSHGDYLDWTWWNDSLATTMPEFTPLDFSVWRYVKDKEFFPTLPAC